MGTDDDPASLWGKLLEAQMILETEAGDEWVPPLLAVLHGLDAIRGEWFTSQEFRDVYLLIEGCVRSWANQESGP